MTGPLMVHNLAFMMVHLIVSMMDLNRDVLGIDDGNSDGIEEGTKFVIDDRSLEHYSHLQILVLYHHLHQVQYQAPFPVPHHLLFQVQFHQLLQVPHQLIHHLGQV